MTQRCAYGVRVCPEWAQGACKHSAGRVKVVDEHNVGCNVYVSALTLRCLVHQCAPSSGSML